NHGKTDGRISHERQFDSKCFVPLSRIHGWGDEKQAVLSIHKEILPSYCLFFKKENKKAKYTEIEILSNRF
ncbi:MAG: hypothetical protein JRJ39_10650, partial [Deltaproteobacteria bacterium]|nr:hypothetical protein [Deltaproteobacteria bacterium]